jgi:hypothetical protein
LLRQRFVGLGFAGREQQGGANQRVDHRMPRCSFAKSRPAEETADFLDFMLSRPGLPVAP